MKKTIVFLSALVLCMAMLGCSDPTGGVDEPTRSFTSTRTKPVADEPPEGVEIDDTPWIWNVIGKNWYLTGLRQTGVVGIVPYQPPESTLIYTLNFSAEDVRGTGFINHYRGPYTVGDGQALWINELAVTMMAPMNEPPGFKEDDYFNYLVNAYRWNLAGETLELYSTGQDGKEAVLVFALPDPTIIWPD